MVYTYDNTINNGRGQVPPAGHVEGDNSTFASSLNITFTPVDATGADNTALFSIIRAGDQLQFNDSTSGAVWLVTLGNAPSLVNGTWTMFVTSTSATGTFNNLDSINVQWLTSRLFAWKQTNTGRALLLRRNAPASNLSVSTHTTFFDATGFAGGMTGTGLPKFSWVSSASISMSPTQAQVNAAADAAMAASGYLGIDLEGPNTDLNYQHSSQAQATTIAGYYAQILDWAHARQPGLKCGLWVNFPVTVDGFEHVGQINVPNWRMLDDFVSPTLQSRIDFVSGLLYHGFDGQAGYADFVSNYTAEAKRVAPGKPFYPVMFPYLSVSPNAGQNPPIDIGTWNFMLDTVINAGVAGIGLWAGYGLGSLAQDALGSQFDSSVFWYQPVNVRR